MTQSLTNKIDNLRFPLAKQTITGETNKIYLSQKSVLDEIYLNPEEARNRMIIQESTEKVRKYFDIKEIEKIIDREEKIYKLRN